MNSGVENTYDMTTSFISNPEPQGACCLGTSCSSATEVTCLAAGGTWEGASTTCSPETCAEPVGACCIGDGCFQLVSEICANAGGTFNGVGSDCEDGTCASDCQGDVNNDGTVDGTDLATVLGGWGLAGGDINGDGTTNGEDLAIVLAFWGDC